MSELKGLKLIPLIYPAKGKLQREYLDFFVGHAVSHATAWPHRHVNGMAIRWWVTKELEKPDARAVVAVAASDPDALAGSAAIRPGLVIYAHVKNIPGLRRKGIMTAMLAHLGVEPGIPHGVTIWTPYATRVAAAGKWRIYPAMPPPPEARQKPQEKTP